MLTWITGGKCIPESQVCSPKSQTKEINAFDTFYDAYQNNSLKCGQLIYLITRSLYINRNLE